jgi:hypothetical protein
MPFLERATVDETTLLPRHEIVAYAQLVGEIGSDRACTQRTAAPLIRAHGRCSWLDRRCSALGPYCALAGPGKAKKPCYLPLALNFVAGRDLDRGDTLLVWWAYGCYTSIRWPI